MTLAGKSMVEGTTIDYIDFEEEKARLWQRAYSEVKRLLILKGLENQRVELPNCAMMKSVTLEMPDVLVLEDGNGKHDYGEYFEDDSLFEVYEGLMQLWF